MRKIPFNATDTAIFEEILPSKMKVIVVPFEGADYVRCGVYVNCGSYSHNEKINQTKIPLGTANLLRLCLEETKIGNINELFEKFNAKYFSKIDPSYTYFGFEAYKEYQEALKYLLAMVSNLDFEETNVEKAKLKVLYDIEKEQRCPYLTIEDSLRKSLYLGSPIRDNNFGSADSLKSVHLNTLKKLFNQFYSVENMTLIVMGKVDPLEVSSIVTNVKMINRFTPAEVLPIHYTESYGTSAKTSDVVSKFANCKLCAFGIKFLPRQELFTQYTGTLFAMYEILGEYLFGNESNFTSQLLESKVINKVISYKVIEASEDAYLEVIFDSDDYQTLKRELYDYMVTLEKKFDGGQFERAKEKVYFEGIKNLGSLLKYEEKILGAYANHIAYPTLLENVKAVKKATFRNFVENTVSMPNSFVSYFKS